MAAQAKMKMVPGAKSGLSSTPLASYPQKTSATFIVGAPVKLASNVLVACSLNTSSGASSNTDFVKKSSVNLIVGIAQGKAVASVTTNIAVAELREGVTLIGNLVHSTASSAKVSKVGSTVYLGKDGSSDTHYGWSLSAPGASSTAYVAGVIDLLVDPASTVNGRVQARITVGGLLTGL